MRLRHIIECALVIAMGVGLYYGVRPATEASDSNPTASPAPLSPKTPDDGEAAAKSSPPPEDSSASLSRPDRAGLDSRDVEAMRQIRARFAAGDFVTALKLADRHALRKSHTDVFRDWLMKQMPVLLTSAGWSRLKLGDCEGAREYLQRAMALDPSAKARKGLAVCLYKRRNWPAAAQQLERYLEEEPQDVSMKVIYADVLESQGRFGDAVNVLEQVQNLQTENAEEEAPMDPEDVADRLRSMRARVQESEHQRVMRSDNFRVTYRAYEHEALVHNVVRVLEDALYGFVDRYGFRVPDHPLEVTLYPAENFQNLVAGGPAWAEGVFDGRLRIPIKQTVAETGDVETLKTVLRHELVHALFAVKSDNRRLPSWFDEGIAQRLSCTPQACEPFSFPPSPGEFLVPQAFAAPYTSLSSVKAGRAYRQSLYLIFVLEEEFGTGAFARLIEPIGYSTSLESNDLLSPLSWSFEDLHDRAASLWEEREVIGH